MRTVASVAFELTENERITTASEYRDGALICRPVSVMRWANLLLAAFAVVAALALVGGLDPDAGPAVVVAAVGLSLALVAASIVWAVAFARSHVRADSNGLTIRDRLRVHRIGWDVVAGFGVVEQDAPLRWLGHATGGFTWHHWPDEAIPVVRLSDGSERRLFLLASSRRSNGWSLGDITPAEQRAAILSRFKGAVTEVRADHTR